VDCCVPLDQPIISAPNNQSVERGMICATLLRAMGVVTIRSM
jgi:hypothetical protein